MPAPLKNQFYKQRSKHGRDRIFSSPEVLWEEACKYFDWCDSNPLVEEKVFGTGKKLKAKLKRVYTITGLCYFLRINIRTLNEYKTNYEGFFPVIEEIEQIIYTQKFEGASVNIFNANIIARDLGLVDKKDVSIDLEKFLKDAIESGSLSEEHLRKIAGYMIEYNQKRNKHIND